MPYTRLSGPDTEGMFTLSNALSASDTIRSGYTNPYGEGGINNGEKYSSVWQLVTRKDNEGEHSSVQSWTYKVIQAENQPTYTKGSTKLRSSYFRARRCL